MVYDPATDDERTDPMDSETSGSSPEIQTTAPAPEVASAPEIAAAPEAAAAPATPDPSTTVEGRMEGLLAKDSNYMARARSSAVQSSEKRGLLNSSIAATAGEAAAIDAALPIAAQDAGQGHALALSEQEATQREGLLAQDIAGQSAIQSEGATQRSELLAQDTAGRTAIQNFQLESQERIAALNVAANDKEKAAATAALMESSYADMFRTISTAPDIPAEKREEYLMHIANIRDSSLALLEQMFAVDLTWSTPGVV